MKLENTNMNKNICEEIELLVDEYLDGMISTDDKKKMDDHITGCAGCKKYLEDTVVILEKAVLLSRLPAVRHGDTKLPSKQKKAEIWNKVESKISSANPASDTHIYNMSGLEDEYIPFTPKDESKQKNTQETKTGRWSSFRYYMSGIAAVLVLAFVIYGVNQFLKRGTGTIITDGIVDVSAPHWKVVPLKGNPMINNLVMKAYDSLGIGGYIITDDSSKAELYVANLGSVIIEPNTKVKLVKSDEGEHRIELEYGSIDASILAKPRSFFVDAGNVTAVDLGCSYKFSIDRNGDGLLYVRSGMVALESASGRESIVPEGKYCVTKNDIGPGTPFREDSAPELKKALMEFDFGNCGSQCVNVILKNANKNDAVTLVNIIPRVDAEYKTRVYERVANFCPPPNSIPTDSIPKLKKLENLNEWVDKIMVEVHKNIEENMQKVEEQMKNFDFEKWNTEWQKDWDKNIKKNLKYYYYLPEGKDTLINYDFHYVPSPEEMEELQRELQEMHNEIQFDNEEFKREMEKVKEELQRVNEEIQRDMEGVQKEIEKEKKEIEKEQRELEKQQRKLEKEQRKLEKQKEKEKESEKNKDN